MEYNLEKQHRKGKLHAIERLRLLLDDNSFLEQFSGVKHSCTSFGMQEREIPYDGVITGFGTISGKTVAVYSQDFTVQGGSLGYLHGQKIAELYKKAIEIRCPIIGINDSGGARIQEGVSALAGYGDIFMQNVRASGYIPQISIIAGPCAGGAVYSPGITDFVFMVDSVGFMFITGSKVVKAALAIQITDEQLGGSAIHAQTSGVAHFRCPTEQDCFKKVKRLLEYIPHWNTDTRAKKEFYYTDTKHLSFEHILPKRPNRGYDVTGVINALTDDDSFFEVQGEFARNMVIGFAHIAGNLVGIVANQPAHLGGIADSDASDKTARFIRYCDAFNIPLLTLVDIPGFVPGPDEERKGIIRHGAKLIYAYAEATVPKVTLILRKAYGGAYIAMCSKHLGADFVYAWPAAEIAVMGAESAVRILFTKEFEKIPDENHINSLQETYRKEYMNPSAAAEKGYITGIIRPEETRDILVKSFHVLNTKRTENKLCKKHGNIPL